MMRVKFKVVLLMYIINNNLKSKIVFVKNIFFFIILFVFYIIKFNKIWLGCFLVLLMYVNVFNLN